MKGGQRGSRASGGQPGFHRRGGPTPSFYWGNRSLPDLGEYYRHKKKYDLLFALPYYAAGGVITLVGLGITPGILRRSPVLRERLFLSAFLVTLGLLLLVATASDAGSVFGVWRGPLFLWHGAYDAGLVRPLGQVFLPGCIVSVLAAIDRAAR